jgi:uracil-DNA glycosylase
MKDAVGNFIALLEAGPSDPASVFNPWRQFDDRDRSPRKATPALRRENLAAYLRARERSARFMLLGEAPSHRGCRFSGIAFCSETELIHKRDQVAREPLVLTSAGAEAKPQRERSAAVIWDEIERAGCSHDVVLWNAFPWHPYGDVLTSNRKPKIREVEHGRLALKALLQCFPHPLQIFAVGKVAEDALRRWPEFACAGYMRHPAQGGETLFRAHFRNLVAGRL